jgi:HD-like signal output (HDOD) protein/signal transduction histidine kinase
MSASPEAPVIPRASASHHGLPDPQSLLRLMQMADDDAVTMAQLAVVVEQDPGLCVRIITAANSPGLRRGTELRSIADCLTSLGTRLIRSIATCLSLQSMFDRRNETIRSDLTPFWRHSLSVAEAARDLGAALSYPHPEEAYFAGLLHDVGELLLLSALGGSYAQVLTLAEDETVLPTIEREHLGVDHADVGAWLIDRWNIDSAIADSILFHHVDAERIISASTLPKIVWLAHALAKSDLVSEATRAQAGRMFDLDLALNLEKIRLHARERTEQIALAIGIPAIEFPALPETTMLQVSVATPRPADGKTESEIDDIMRDMVLMQPLQRDLFGLESDVELLMSLRESARILFDLTHIAFFLRGPGDERLSAANIRPDATHCMVAAAASSRRIVSSFDADYPQPAALIDLQFARVFGTEGLLCVPMNGRSRTIGVMVFGLSAGQYSRLARRLPWVLNFGRIAALSIEAWHEAINYRKRAEDDASARFERQARRVVHEAGNPLGIIKGYLKILDGKLPADAKVREELGVLREEIDRVAGIVRRLSDPPRQSVPGDALDLSALIRELLALYDAALFKSRAIEVVFTPGEVHGLVACERDTLKQVLLNLWKNAAEAMPDGGRIEIELSDGVMQNGRRHVELKIADNGPGIPTEALAKLAATESEASPGGRGIGLSIVGGLVSQMGASISCRSRAQTGTVFTLLLPCPV